MSVLSSVKSFIGEIPDDETLFDNDLVLLINSSLSMIKDVYDDIHINQVSKDTENWDDVVDNVDVNDLNQIKLFVLLKCKLVFDPPANSFLVSAIEDQLKELKWFFTVKKGDISP